MMNPRPSFIVCLFSLGCAALWCAEAPAVENRDAPVRIPAGEFQMGTEAGTARERPIHKVWVDAFVIDRLEISNKAYETWQPGHRRSHVSACDECPVTLVTWQEAVAFCQHQAGRLPTEAEWEKAARGPNGFAYGFGNRPDGSKGNFGKGLRDGAVPVNSFSPNGYGLHQMNGNVWEWVGDWFGPYPEKRIKNPKGPDTGFQKIVRGGSWHNTAYYIHAGMRFKLDPNVSLNSVGFRCIYDLPGEKSNQ